MVLLLEPIPWPPLTYGSLGLGPVGLFFNLELVTKVRIMVVHHDAHKGTYSC